MSGDWLLLDTSFLQALLNRKDQHHDAAKSLLPRVTAANEVWVTEAVLIELANALSALNREGAAKFIEQCYWTANVHVVNVGTLLLESALDFYRARSDKEWMEPDRLHLDDRHARTESRRGRHHRPPLRPGRLPRFAAAVSATPG